MAWGTEQEPFARAAYELIKDALVQEVGFVLHPSISEAGASPDGLVGEFGLLEIKCPLTATHISTLLDQKVPEKYNTQMQWQMACTKTTLVRLCKF
jgi:predicted phage-related endonuclease